MTSLPALKSIPATTAPKSLRSEVKTHQRLPADKCIELGISLTQALASSAPARPDSPRHQAFQHHFRKRHAEACRHRLVAEQSEAKSFVGTEGFIPPEGPGTPQADIYSLGKVLYEIATGKDRHDFPELPTMLDEDSSEHAVAGAQLSLSESLPVRRQIALSIS
jgi:serine/threonine protein kinase